MSWIRRRREDNMEDDWEDDETAQKDEDNLSADDISETFGRRQSLVGSRE